MKRALIMSLALISAVGAGPVVQAQSPLSSTSVEVCVNVEGFAEVSTPIQMGVSLSRPQQTQGGPGLAASNATISVTTNSRVNLEVAATTLFNTTTGIELPAPATYGYKLDATPIPRDNSKPGYAFLISDTPSPGQQNQHTITLWADWFMEDANGHSVEYRKVSQGLYQGHIMITVSPI